MAKRQLYLTEDQDLLNELGTTGPVPRGQALSELEIKLSILQIQATLRHRKTTADLSRSTDIYSRALILFAVIQILIAASQFVIAVIPENRWLTAILGIGIAALVIFGARIVGIVDRAQNQD